VKETYRNQVTLMLQILPIVAECKCFALKGGTAINFFYRSMPRLSVDIDLTYTHIEPRETSLTAINKEMEALKNRISKQYQHLTLEETRTKDTKVINRLFIKGENTVIKIEPNHIMRGTVLPCETKLLCDKAQEDYAVFAEIQTVSKSDLYAGKICAALDRQHPRDLFDIKLLFDNEGITPEMRKTFIVYLACSPRPMNELLAPNELDMQEIFDKEFSGMTEGRIDYNTLSNTRSLLINTIQEILTSDEKDFLISLKSDDPDWSLMGLPNISELPAIKWKLQNIQKMSEAKKQDALAKLREVLKA